MASPGGSSGSPATHGMHHLPEHLLLRCLEPLAHRDLLTAASVSREWAAVARCESLWRLRCQVSLRERRCSSTLWCRSPPPLPPLAASARPPLHARSACSKAAAFHRTNAQTL